MNILLLNDQRTQVEQQLIQLIQDTAEYNELFAQWQELNTEIAMTHYDTEMVREAFITTGEIA